MESSWRRNVTDLGLGDTGAGLAARYLATPVFVLTNVRKIDGSCTIWFVPPAGTPDAPYNTDAAGPVAYPNFPYGQAVEPDVHL